MTKRYQQYSKEFKLETIRLWESSGRSMSEIERELGITIGMIGKWRKRYQIDPEEQSLIPSDLEAARKEVRRLRRELEITKEEHDILKKAIRIFSKEKR